MGNHHARVPTLAPTHTHAQTRTRAHTHTPSRRARGRAKRQLSASRVACPVDEECPTIKYTAQPPKFDGFNPVAEWKRHSLVVTLFTKPCCRSQSEKGTDISWSAAETGWSRRYQGGCAFFIRFRRERSVSFPYRKSERRCRWSWWTLLPSGVVERILPARREGDAETTLPMHRSQHSAVVPAMRSSLRGCVTCLSRCFFDRRQRGCDRGVTQVGNHPSVEGSKDSLEHTPRAFPY